MYINENENESESESENESENESQTEFLSMRQQSIYKENFYSLTKLN